MVKGVIYGLLRRYYEQNSRPSDYKTIAALLYRRLLDRVHQPKDQQPIFLWAHKKIQSTFTFPTLTPTAQPPPPPNTKRCLFLHLEYHPCDIPRREVRRLYDKYCGGIERFLGLETLTITYSRPKNLGDIATQARLFEAPEQQASTYMGEYDQGLAP